MKKVKDSLLYFLIYASAFITLFLLIGIILYIFYKGISFVNWSFLTSVSSSVKGTVGIAGNILNTIIIVILTIIIAAPIGIGAAIYLNEYAKNGKLTTLIEFATEILSGIPSIIFGLFGMIFFGQTLGLGYSLLTGSLTLIIMILPLIIRNTQEALKSVPDSYRDGAMGLGSTKWQMIWKILLPSSMPGILTGIILSIGRIIGESAALLFTAGSAKTLPKTVGMLFKKLGQSGGTLSVQLYLSATSEGKFDMAFGIASVLIIIVLIINFSMKYITRKLDIRVQE